MTTGEILTPRQTAEILGVTPQTLAYWRSRSEGPRCFKLGARTVRYRREDVERWAQVQYETTAA